jgi:hypothetical protein
LSDFDRVLKQRMVIHDAFILRAGRCFEQRALVTLPKRNR